MFPEQESPPTTIVSLENSKYRKKLISVGTVAVLVFVAGGIAVVALFVRLFLFPKIAPASPEISDAILLPPDAVPVSVTIKTDDEHEQSLGASVNQGETPRGFATGLIPVPVAPKTHVEFEKQFEISANQNATPRGYIAASIDGKTFWVVSGKLAYVVNYFGPSNTNIEELFYDGEKIKIHDDTTNYTVTNDFINGVPEITDKLSYYTFNLDKFFFGDEVYPKVGVIFDAQSVGGKLALVSQSGLTYDGQTVDTDYHNVGKIYSIGGKLAFKKTIRKNDGSIESELVWNGKPYVTGPQISDVVDFQGLPAYVQYDSSTQPSKAVVIYKGQKVSKEYQRILNLKVIGGKIAFLAQKNVANLETLSNKRGSSLYKLVWNGEEYGTQYDTVTGYIDSAGVPAYIAVNYVREDGQSKPANTQYLVRGGDVVFTGKQGEEMIWQERELADVGGNPAIIVRAPKTNSLYVYYAGKKFFEGYDIYYVRNVSGKLAVLAAKDRVQYVFMEK